MKIIVCLLICACSYFQLFSQGVDFKQITLKEALEQAKAQGKMVFVDCYTTWCGPCKQIAPYIEELAEEYKDKVNIGKCDVDENADLPAQFGVRNIPTVLFIKNGEVVDKQVGATTKSALQAKVEALLK